MKTELEIKIEKIIESTDKRINSLYERMTESSEDYKSYFVTRIKLLEQEKLQLMSELSK